MPRAAATVAHRLRIVDPTLSGATDRQLLDRYLAESDQTAFAELVRRHERAILSVCRQVLFDRADVEDAFQATFVALVERARRIKWKDTLGGWLVTVAHRVAVRTARTRSRLVRRERNAAAQPSPPTPEVGADLSWREAIGVLHEELDALPDRFRLPLILCYLEGLSREEASSRLGWKVGMVKAGLERGREKLRVILERRGVTLSAGLLAGVVACTQAASASPELRAATLKAVTGQTSTAILELARSAMPAITTKAKVVYGSVIAAALCVGLLAAMAGSPARVDPPATPVAPPTKVTPAQPQEIAGRVLDPDGKPIAGVKIYAVKQTISNEERAVVATSAADGTFKAPQPSSGEGVSLLVAQKDGFGVAWHTFGNIDGDAVKSTVDLQLVRDHAITGRVIDTEGKPLAGVRVFASQIDAPKAGNLDQVLDEWKRHLPSGVPANLGRTHHGSGTSATQTDVDGKFQLTGCGAERIVELGIQAENLAGKSVTVVNRAKFDPSGINAVAKVWQAESPSRPLFVVYGPEVRVVAERAKTIEGVVVDAKTKKPIAGATVTDMRTPLKADAEGRFRLTKFRKAPHYTVYAAGPEDGDYFARTFRIDDTEGYSTVKCQVELTRGVALTGTVTDKVTGKPVMASVSVMPLAGNAHFAKYYPSNQTLDHSASTTDSNGRFRVVAIPGKSIVIVYVRRIRLGEAELLPYRGAGPDPAHSEVFDMKRQTGFMYVTLADGTSHPLSNRYPGLRVLDIPADGKSPTVNFALDPGVKGSIQIQGPDGKPVSDTTVIGLGDATMPVKISEASATVYTLDPKADPRRILVWDSKKQLGGMALIRGNEREAVTVKLAPLASVRGKCVTAEGKPVDGLFVLIHCPEPLAAVDSYLHTEFSNGRFTRIKTAADGTFTVPGLLPGIGYQLTFWNGKSPLILELAKTVSAKPESGKVVDLGTIDVGTLGEK